jgi:hypothetical protein
VIGVLMSLTYPLAEQQHKELQAAASERGLQIHVVNASEEKGIDAAFKTFAERRIDALLVTAVPYFTNPAGLPAWTSSFRAVRSAMAPGRAEHRPSARPQEQKGHAVGASDARRRNSRPTAAAA